MTAMKKYILLLFLLKLSSASVFSENSDFNWMSSPSGNSFFSSSSFEEWNPTPFQEQDLGINYNFSELFLSENTLLMAITPSVEVPNPSLRPGDYGNTGGIGQIPIGNMNLSLVFVVILYMLIVCKTTKRRTNDQWNADNAD